jgi:hypothetical protein
LPRDADFILLGDTLLDVDTPTKIKVDAHYGDVTKKSRQKDTAQSQIPVQRFLPQLYDKRLQPTWKAYLSNPASIRGIELAA